MKKGFIFIRGGSLIRIQMEREFIETSPISVEWNDWFPWDDLKVDVSRGGIKIPNKKTGVYEVKHRDAEERLTIGKASDLRMRIRQGLVKGKISHLAGKEYVLMRILQR